MKYVQKVAEIVERRLSKMSAVCQSRSSWQEGRLLPFMVWGIRLASFVYFWAALLTMVYQACGKESTAIPLGPLSYAEIDLSAGH